MSSSKFINKKNFYYIFHRHLKKIRYSYFFTSFILLERNYPNFQVKNFNTPNTAEVFCTLMCFFQVFTLHSIKIHRKSSNAPWEFLIQEESIVYFKSSFPFYPFRVFSDQKMIQGNAWSYEIKTYTILFRVSKSLLVYLLCFLLAPDTSQHTHAAPRLWKHYLFLIPTEVHIQDTELQGEKSKPEVTHEQWYLNIFRSAYWFGFSSPHMNTCKINWGDSSPFPASVTGRGISLALPSHIFICKNVPAEKYHTSNFYSKNL